MTGIGIASARRLDHWRAGGHGAFTQSAGDRVVLFPHLQKAYHEPANIRVSKMAGRLAEGADDLAID